MDGQTSPESISTPPSPSILTSASISPSPSNSDPDIKMTDHPTAKAGKGAPDLSQMATRAAIEHLKSVIPNANYCCGGSIPITTPVTIRFDNSSTSSIHKIQFPSSPSSNDLSELLLASKRATFGLNGKDVLDETYRKAAALDKEMFSTNFHPADHGVLDALSQVLVPDYGLRVEGKRKELWGIKAELYKLNASFISVGWMMTMEVMIINNFVI